MCNQQGNIETHETVRPPLSAPAPRPALQAGGRAQELAGALADSRARVIGQPEAAPKAIPVVTAAPTSVPTPLPVAAIPEVRAAVEKAIAAPTPEPAAPEKAPVGPTFRIAMDNFKGHQQRNLGRVMGDRMVVKGLGLITFAKEGNELVVTLPVGSTTTKSQVISALQNHLNK